MAGNIEPIEARAPVSGDEEIDKAGPRVVELVHCIEVLAVHHGSEWRQGAGCALRAHVGSEVGLPTKPVLAGSPRGHSLGEYLICGKVRFSILLEFELMREFVCHDADSLGTRNIVTG